MQNPKEFKATPMDHFKPTPHSGPEPKRNKAEKSHPTKATPWSHSAPTKKSGHEGMGDLSGHFKKNEMKAGATPMKVGKSSPKVPREVKKVNMLKDYGTSDDKASRGW